METTCRCKVCGKTFTQKKSIKKHMLIHAGIKPYSCSLCGWNFRSQDDCDRHNVLHTSTVVRQTTHKCSKCTVSFKQLEHLKKHEKTHKLGKHSCDVCVKGFKDVYWLIKHKLVHKNKERKCGICFKQFKTYSFLCKHTLTHVENSLKCGICCKDLLKGSLKRHIMVVHIEDATDYGDTTVESLDINDNPEEGLAESEEIHKCNLCGREYSQADYLEAHMLVHSEEKYLYSCRICKKQFTLRKLLQTHLTTHNEQLLVCTLCKKQFSLPSALKKHMSHMHSDAKMKGYSTKKYKDCGETKSNPDPDDLPGTMDVDMYKKMHACRVCGREYSRVGYLKAHMIQHANKENNYKCKYCGKQFVQLKRLNRHLLKYCTEKKRKRIDSAQQNCQEGEKLVASTSEEHACKICGREFSQVWWLKAHMILHENKENGFKCKYCGKQFVQMKRLNKHLLKFCSEKKQHYNESARQHRQEDAKLVAPTSVVLEGIDDKHICSICGKGFTRFVYLRAHVHSHKRKKSQSEDKLHKCSECGKEFLKAVSLNCHMIQHKKLQWDKRNSTANPLNCYFCNIPFRDSRHRETHMQMHKSEEYPKCRICGCKYKELRYLQEHMAFRHYNESPHNCEICGKTFLRPKLLRNHMERTHKMEKKNMTNSKASTPTVVHKQKPHSDFNSKASKPSNKVLKQKFHNNGTPNSVASKPTILVKQKFHNGVASVDCSKCGKNVKVPWNAEVRCPDFGIKSKKETFPQTCGVCIEEFSQPDVFMRHVLSHSRHYLLHM